MLRVTKKEWFAIRFAQSDKLEKNVLFALLSVPNWKKCTIRVAQSDKKGNTVISLCSAFQKRIGFAKAIEVRCRAPRKARPHLLFGGADLPK
jgi:hypothetical protein